MILACVFPISVKNLLNYYVPCFLAKNAHSRRFVVSSKKGTHYSFEFLDRNPKFNQV